MNENRPSPYKGLLPYEEGDAAYFFGRETDTDIIAANLISSRLTLLYGPSGVGKSSVLRAGVVNTLRRRTRENLDERREPEIIVVYFNNWRTHPVPTLIETVAHTIRETVKLPEAAATNLADTLHGYAENAKCNLLIILDQFEEYFLYHAREEGENSFVNEFSRAVNRAGLRANFILSFREDALAKLDFFKGHIPNLYKNYLRIKHLDTEAARDAIIKPLSRFNELNPNAPHVAIEDALVDEVLQQVRVGSVVLGEKGRGAVEESRGEADIETPYLQLVMTRLWDETSSPPAPSPEKFLQNFSGEGEIVPRLATAQFSGEGELTAVNSGEGGVVLRLATLQELGGAEQIVRAHLQKAIDKLDPAEQRIAASVFDRLVTPSGTKIAQTARDLARNAKVSEAELDGVLENLASGQNRILRGVAPAPEQPDAPRYEIFHDVLSGAILEWRAKYEKDQELLTAAARAEEERIKQEQDLKQQQTEETLTLERTARARQRRLLIGAVVLFVVALAASVVAGVLFLQAQERERNAAQQERIARSREFAAVANGQLGVDPEVSILLAREGADFATSDEAVSALRRALSISRVRAVTPNEGKAIGRVAYSPDNAWLAVGDITGQARVFKADDLQLQTTLPASNAPIRYLQFMMDNQTLFTFDGVARFWDFRLGKLNVEKEFRGATDARLSPLETRAVFLGGNTIFLWNLETDTVTQSEGHENPVHRANFSANGTKFATASLDTTARVWDADAGQEILALRGHTLPVVDVSFSPDGTLLATSSDDNTARVWDAQTGQEKLRLNHDAPVTRALFSPDSRFVATASSRTANVWDSGTGNLIAVLRGHSALITDLGFSPDGTQLTTTSLDGTARVWEPFSGNLIAELRGHAGAVSGFASSPDLKRIVTASSDGTARVWDVSRDSSVAKLLSLDAPPQRAVLSHSGDGKFLATGSSNGEITVWDLEAQAALFSFKAHAQPIIGLALSPDDTTLATAGLDSRVVLWDFDVSKKRAAARLERANLAVNDLAYSPDGKQLVTVDSDGAVVIRDANTLEPLGAQPPTQQANLQSVAWSKDGTRMAWGGLNGIVLWDTGNQTPIVTISDQTLSALDIEFSPNGLWLVFGGGDSIARVWNPQTGEPLLALRGHGGPIDAVTFDRESQFIVTGSWDNTARVWETATGNLVKELGGHTEDVTGVFYALNRTTIVTTSKDGSIQLNVCEVCVDHTGLRILAKQRVTRALSCVEYRIYFHQTGVGCLPTPTPLVTTIAPPTAAPVESQTPALDITRTPAPPTLTFPPTGCVTRITGVVFNDEDKSGVRDGKEQGIAGVTVQLLHASTDAKILASATTDASGNYAFSNLPAGRLRVDVSNPRNFSATMESQQHVELSECETRRGVDFGFVFNPQSQAP